MTTKIVRRYLHDESDLLSPLWASDAPQQEIYAYALYEVAVDLEVDMESGRSRIVAVDNKSLADPGPFLPPERG